MNKHYLENGILNLKEIFKNDICSKDFNNFLFFTYSIDPEYINWFPEKSNILFCVNKKIHEKVKESGFLNKVKIKSIDTHAKLYLMWNKKEIKCWTGSFNFTKKGLSENIEWATCFCGELKHPLDIQDFVNGNLRFSTDNLLINQIIDFISKKMNGNEEYFSDNIFLNTSFNTIFLHNQGTNTLRKTIVQILKKAKKSIKITYITPFINKSGVLNFTKNFENLINPKKIDLEIITNKPDLSYGENTFLKSEQIEDLNNKYREFKILKRKQKKKGKFLPNGTELSEGFIHLKLIHIFFINDKGEEEKHSIFTSSNLTQSAWGEDDSKNTEIGIWVKDEVKNDAIHSFIDIFRNCFSEPDKDELDDIDRTIDEIENKNLVEEYWLDDYIKNNIRINKNNITVEWAKYLPKITDLNGKIFYKNLLNGEITNEKITFDKMNNSNFCGKISNLVKVKNSIIDFIELDLKSNFKPPEFKIKSRFINKVISHQNKKRILELKDKLNDNWNEVILNEEMITLKNNTEIEIPDDIKDVNAISLRKCYNSFEKTNIIIKAKSQPHLNSSFFIDSRLTVESLNDFGNFIRLDLTVNEKIDPPFDTIDFIDNEKNQIDYLGFSKNKNKISYFFDQNIDCEKIKAIVKEPYKKYFNESIKIKIPVLKKVNVSKIVDVIKDIKFIHKIPGLDIHDPSLIDNFISEKTKIKIFSPSDLISTINSTKIKYICKKEMLFYNPPKIFNLNCEIDFIEPFTRVSYRGVIQVKKDNDEINLLTDKNSFVVRKNIINKILIQDKQKIPGELPLDKMKNNDPIFWLLINEKNIKTNFLSKEFNNNFHLDVWKNDVKLIQKNIFVNNIDKSYYIPIFKDEIGKKIELLFILSYNSDNSFFSNFAWSYRREEYNIIRWGMKNIKVGQKNWSIPVKNNNDADYSDLYIDFPSISKYRLDDASRKNDFITLISPNKIYLHPNENMLVCFT